MMVPKAESCRWGSMPTTRWNGKPPNWQAIPSPKNNATGDPNGTSGPNSARYPRRQPAGGRVHMSSDNTGRWMRRLNLNQYLPDWPKVTALVVAWLGMMVYFLRGFSPL